MKRAICFALCMLLIFSGCMVAEPNATEGTTLQQTETEATGESVQKGPIIGSAEGFEQGDDEWEEDHEEPLKPTDGSGDENATGKNPSAGSVPNNAGVVLEAQQKAVIGYYFMSGEGVLSPSNGDFFSKWGDSTLIVFPNGQTMLVDSGVKNYYPKLKERLHSLGVYKLDYVVFTHPHDDHCGGMWAGLFDDFSIGRVYHSGLKNAAWGDGTNLRQIASKCEAYGISASILKKGDVLTIGQGSELVTMKVLWPTGQFAVTEGQSIKGSGEINNRSLVLRFDYGQHSSLFPGDIYKTKSHTGQIQSSDPTGGEDALLAYYTNGELDVDLLKLAHHGDASSSNSNELFSATTPDLAVATGFVPIESHWGLYKYVGGKAFNSGYNNKVLFDRYNGYITVRATADGTMKYETSRNGYLPDFGKSWNPDLDRK